MSVEAINKLFKNIENLAVGSLSSNSLATHLLYIFNPT